jgi:CheY-like chemotaxis protein
MGESDRSDWKHGPLDRADQGVEVPCPPGVAGCSVLVVEDNPELAKNLGRLVRLLGHEPRIAHSGSDGLLEARRCPPDVLLCDIGLPGMDGNDLARAIRADAALAHIRLIAMSGGDLDDDRDQTFAAGFNVFLAKPMTFDQLRQALHEALHAAE